MFVPFFESLRRAGVPVTLREYLTLLEAMRAGVGTYDVEHFYYLARSALVKDERRGSLMSLTVALGQLGFAAGSAIAGPVFASRGYFSNTLLAAASVLAMGLIVWFFIPEPRMEEAPAAEAAGA